MEDMVSQDKKIARIEYVDSCLPAHQFTETLSNITVSCSVLKLKDSVFLWIGTGSHPRLSDMCLAMKSPYDSLPVTTQILGPQTNEGSSSLASQLAKLLKKPVFVSLNIELDRFLSAELLKRLKEEIKNKPDCF